MASEGKETTPVVEASVVAPSEGKSEDTFGRAKKLSSKLTITDSPSEVFVVKYSPDGKLLAAGCGDGAIRVFNSQHGRLLYTLNGGASEKMPTTALRFRPITAASKTKNVLLAVNADGTAQHWHITSGKCLHTVREEDNQLYCVDFRSDGASFATAGKDRTVRIYDEATKSLVSSMSGGTATVTAGHSNRVFSLKYNPKDDNVLISGGWDNTVQLWDVRAGHAVRCIFGPFICGDGVDLHDDVVLTGSWRTENTLEMWDYGSGKLIERVNWNQSALKGEGSMLYAAHFSTDPRGVLIGAGGSSANMAKVFDRSRGNAVVGTIAGLSRGVFSLDFNGNEEIAVAGGDAAVRVFKITETRSGGGAAKSESKGAEAEAK